MGFLEKVYEISPIFFQNIMASISGYQRNSKRYGKVYNDYRIFLEDFDRWSLDKKYEYQTQQLIKFINYANENSPFYRKLYKDIDISKIKGVEDLKKLPIVDKEMLRQNINEVYTIPSFKGVKGKTGGTTGKSLVVRYREEDSMMRMAMLDNFKSRVGFEHRKMKRATFNGKHIVPPNQTANVYWRYNLACKKSR